MAYNTECACTAVTLLTRMNNLMESWWDNPTRYDNAVRKLLDEMDKHLEKQLDEPMNSVMKRENSEILTKIDTAALDARVGKPHPMANLDVLRDAIHRSQPIRQAFLCEPPGEETDLSRKVSVPMNVLGGNTEAEDPFKTTREELKRIYDELQCSIK